jgi:hypothetical protein
MPQLPRVLMIIYVTLQWIIAKHLGRVDPQPALYKYEAWASSRLYDLKNICWGMNFYSWWDSLRRKADASGPAGYASW